MFNPYEFDFPGGPTSQTPIMSSSGATQAPFSAAFLPPPVLPGRGGRVTGQKRKLDFDTPSDGAESSSKPTESAFEFTLSRESITGHPGNFFYNTPEAFDALCAANLIDNIIKILDKHLLETNQNYQTNRTVFIESINRFVKALSNQLAIQNQAGIPVVLMLKYLDKVIPQWPVNSKNNLGMLIIMLMHLACKSPYGLPNVFDTRSVCRLFSPKIPADPNCLLNKEQQAIVNSFLDYELTALHLLSFNLCLSPDDLKEVVALYEACFPENGVDMREEPIKQPPLIFSRNKIATTARPATGEAVEAVAHSMTIDDQELRFRLT